jgi:Family of unknown function (DUF5691)
MSLWTEIVNTALIGCQRKPLSLDGATGELSVLLGSLDQNDREGALLETAALAALYERAATLPIKDTQPLPEACEPDDTSRCSERAAIHLAMMLRGEHGDVLPEWLAKMAAAGRRPPRESLPQLLELGRTQVSMISVWKEISQMMGARGRWLAAQNPDWAYALGGFDETLWETASGKQRAAVLAELRKRDAARGRELLEATWEQESPEDCADILAAFENGLSLDDEAFLEAALDDQRKGVHFRAASLLARLPESAWSRRMFERVRPLIEFKLDDLNLKTIEIVADMATPDDRSRLERMLSWISPKVWSEESGWTVSELIEAAGRSEWELVLKDAWVLAAETCKDAEWAAEALLAEVYEQLDMQYLLSALPEVRREAVLIKLLRAEDTSDQACMCIENAHWWWGRCKWGEALSRAVIGCLVNNLDSYLTLEGLTSSAGLYLDPVVIPKAITRVTNATRPPAERLPEIEQFLALIQFRHEILKEIEQ